MMKKHSEGTLSFIFLMHTRAQATSESSLIQISPALPPGQASQSLEYDSTPRRHNKLLAYNHCFDQMNLCRTVSSQYQHLNVYTR